MIDIHCHILPGFDDGSSGVEESLAMARAAVDSGVTGIVATPHFRGERRSFALLNRLMNRYEKLIQAVQQANIPLYLYPGAEILCLPETPELAKLGQLPTLGNTTYLLVEFFFNESRQEMERMLQSLSDCGYRPVVAHPERYEAVQEDPRILENWFRRGYVLQLNKGSVLGAFGPRVEKTSAWALERGLAHLIASDAHSSRRRTTDMRSLRQKLLETYPAEYVRVLLEDNPHRVVQGSEMVPCD